MSWLLPECVQPDVPRIPCMPSAPQKPAQTIVEQFESAGLWSCRQVNKWLLVSVTLAFGIALGADVLYEMLSGPELPVGLMIAGVLAIGCVMLLWVCVTYAVPAGVGILVLALFVDGMAYSIILAVLLTGLTAQTSTKRFRRGTLAVMIVWAVLVGATLPELDAGLLVAASVSVAVLAAYGIGSANRHATSARLQSTQDLAQAEQSHRASVAAVRKSIARDLHDIVAHDITIIAMQSRAAQIKDTDDAYREAVGVIGNSSRAALNDLRRMLTLLKDEDVVDDESGPIATVSELDVRRGADAFAQRLESIGITVERNIVGDLGTLSRSVSAALYRMLQECTTNVAKYAGQGETCWIEIEVGAEHVAMCVTNTVSVPAQGQHSWGGSSAGLVGVRDRADAFGGSAEAGFDDQGRWRVRVSQLKKA